MTTQCICVKCLLEGRARFDADTNPTEESDIEPEMKAEEKFLRGESLQMKFQAKETAYTKASRYKMAWPVAGTWSNGAF